MQKIKKMQVNARVEWPNWPTFRRLAAEAGLPAQEHKFASVLLNLLAECAAASGQEWDKFKRSLPGYELAMKGRRTAAAAALLATPDRIEDRLSNYSQAQLAALEKEMARIEGDPGLKKKPKAS